MTMPDHNKRCRQMAELQEEKESMARLGALAHNAMQRKKVRDGFEYLAQPDVPVPEPSFQYNPRFAALRGEHELLVAACRHCFIHWNEKDDVPYCLRTGADALLVAAAACGYEVTIAGQQGGVYCNLSSGIGSARRFGPSVVVPHPCVPAEAISAALWQAVVGAR